MPYLARGATELHYLASGNPDHPLLLLLHGGGSTSATWRRVTPHMVGMGFHVIALDLRGHGASARTQQYRLNDYRDDALHLVRQLTVRPYALIGHSLGAHVASCVAQADPDRVTAMVLEEPPVPTAGGVVVDLKSRLRITALRAAQPWGRQRKFQRRALVSAIDELRQPHPDWWRGLADITAPTLIVAGGATSHIPQSRLRDMTAALPGGQMTTIDIGHRVHSKAPAAFEKVVTQYLRSLR